MSNSIVSQPAKPFFHIDRTFIGNRLQDLSEVVFGGALGIGVFGAINGVLSTALITIGGVAVFTPLIAIVAGLTVLSISLFILGRVVEHFSSKSQEENIENIIKQD